MLKYSKNMLNVFKLHNRNDGIEHKIYLQEELVWIQRCTLLPPSKRIPPPSHKRSLRPTASSISAVVLQARSFIVSYFVVKSSWPSLEDDSQLITRTEKKERLLPSQLDKLYKGPSRRSQSDLQRRKKHQGQSRLPSPQFRIPPRLELQCK